MEILPYGKKPEYLAEMCKLAGLNAAVLSSPSCIVSKTKNLQLPQGVSQGKLILNK